MARYLTVTNESYAVDISLDDDLTTVEILDFNTGLRGRAHALRYREDKYNETIGISVASSRALARLARKNEKYYISQTQPRGF